MIVLITGMFDVRRPGQPPKKEFMVSHGVDYETLENICLPNEHPRELGAEYSKSLGEWVLY